MNAVGIDVSKGKSTVTIRRPGDEVLMLPCAAALPEYPVVMAMNDVGPSLGSQLMAEIGGVTRFLHREALTAFAGVDPDKNDSGKRNQKSMRTSKKGSSSL